VGPPQAVATVMLKIRRCRGGDGWGLGFRGHIDIFPVPAIQNLLPVHAAAMLGQLRDPCACCSALLPG
jgi:hypothetical protein